jgi:hypothetical protein
MFFRFAHRLALRAENPKGRTRMIDGISASGIDCVSAAPAMPVRPVRALTDSLDPEAGAGIRDLLEFSIESLEALRADSLTIAAMRAAAPYNPSTARSLAARLNIVA